MDKQRYVRRCGGVDATYPDEDNQSDDREIEQHHARAATSGNESQTSVTSAYVHGDVILPPASISVMPRM